MITRERARDIASQITGQAQESGNWELVEFDAGWLILESSSSNASRRGGALRVVERESGQVVRFPSSVPPQRILSEYAQIVERGRVEYPA
jgi:hypothetical protein